MVIDQADGDLGLRADLADRETLVAVLLQALYGGCNKGLTALFRELAGEAGRLGTRASRGGGRSSL
jgi:hypothetical protein